MREPSSFESHDFGYDSAVETAEPDEWERAEESPIPSPIRLVVQHEPTQPSRGALMKLAHRLGLDVWGQSLLGRRVGQEMAAAALVLTTVLLFELFAWSMLFNVLVHAADWKLSLRTVLAIFLGGLFATVVFVFERSFITADFTEERLRKILAYGLRLLIIGGSIVATAQPIELLVFGKAIENRLHEENVLAEAIRQVEEVNKAEKAAQGISIADLQDTLKETDQFKQRQAAEDEVAALEPEIESRRRAVDRAESYRISCQGRVDRLLEQQNQAQTSLARPGANAGLQGIQEASETTLAAVAHELPAARERLSTATGKLEQAQRMLNDILSQEKNLRDELAAEDGKWKVFFDGERERADAQAKTAQKDLEQRKEWMVVLQGAPAGDVKRPGTDFVLAAKASDFTDRLRVLDDLRHGRPARWPPRTSSEVRAEAEKIFGLGTKDVNPSEMGAELFDQIYRVAFVMASVIPLLTLAFKLMMPRELGDYYSAQAQAEALNPEAVQAIAARRARRRRNKE